MPYTLKPNKLFAKDPNGDGYLPQNVITDKSTSDAIAEIQAAGSTQVSNVNSAGTTQTTRVNTAGNSQVTAISNKATELQTLMNDADTTISKIDALDDIISGLRSLLDLVHPVGSIYISKDPTDPGDMFGGVWSPITDRFLLTAGSTYHVGDADGGEATHKLTKEELPVEHMTLRNLYRVDNGETISIMAQTGTDGNVVPDSAITFNAAHVSAATTAHATVYTYGGDQPHNNMPPYTIVYAWERVQ